MSRCVLCHLWCEIKESDGLRGFGCLFLCCSSLRGLTLSLPLLFAGSGEMTAILNFTPIFTTEDQPLCFVLKIDDFTFLLDVRKSGWWLLVRTDHAFAYDDSAGGTSRSTKSCWHRSKGNFPFAARVARPSNQPLAPRCHVVLFPMWTQCSFRIPIYHIWAACHMLWANSVGAEREGMNGRCLQRCQGGSEPSPFLGLALVRFECAHLRHSPDLQNGANVYVRCISGPTLLCLWQTANLRAPHRICFASSPSQSRSKYKFNTFTIDDVDKTFEKFVQLKYSQDVALLGIGSRLSLLSSFPPSHRSTIDR